MVLIRLLAVLGLWNLMERGCSQCINSEPNQYCDAEAAVGECWLSALINCQCQKSCNSRPVCPGVSMDHDCACLAFVAGCSDPHVSTSCYTTCERRVGVVCHSLPTIPHASPSNPSPLYGDKVTFSCDVGYTREQGSDGLRICILDGSWVVSNKTGIPPVCQAVSCGSSPAIRNYVASSATGVYQDTVTYDCAPTSVMAGGGGARHACNASGVWVKDSSDIYPLCVDVTNYYHSSSSEIDTGAAPTLSVVSARSGLDCARFCSISPFCQGYTYNKTNTVCSLNVGPSVPIVTGMKRVYIQK
ncbi:sushi, von Willebrand factor type A, EGF and pentraxin domain-containing protein 1-like [Haliotis rubra]|uniref:sushi, von Willebrand factor type A, EGF and pentraxin domain-containing protein 1-like n=1 Tax=Haliotis rubra TaxID=36100 RepID=UPI001EE6367A|nr:sushi, von Willebrand factor type A, EGF and pentraxin domain-containing protein 1-like [Haliotis rubra]